MKLWVYYLKDKDVLKDLNRKNLLDSFSEHYEDGKPFLYAYTTKKKTAKWFKQVHNMDIFLERVEEDIDKSTFEKFENQYRNFCEITPVNLYTSQTLKEANEKGVLVPLTRGEYWFTVECGVEVMQEISDLNYIIPIGIFSGDLFALLVELMYDTDILDMSGSSLNGDKVFEYVKENRFKNEIGRFIYLYHKTLDPVKLIEVMENE